MKNNFLKQNLAAFKIRQKETPEISYIFE